MGVVAKTRTEVNRLKQQKYRAKKKQAAAIGALVQSTDKATQEFLQQFPIAMREKILKQSVRAASRIVANEVRKEMRKAGRIPEYGKSGPLRPRSTDSHKAAADTARRYRRKPRTTSKNATIGRSKVTGTRNKWSFGGPRGHKMIQRLYRKWDMYDSAGVKVKTYDNQRVILGMTGFRDRKGSQAWILEHGGTIKLWGGKTYRLPARPFMRPAAARSLPAQKKAMEDKMKKEWTKL